MITYSNFNNVGSDKVQVLQTSEDGAELSGGPTACLRSASGRGKSRVEGVDINGEVHRVLGADPVDDSLDDTFCANGVDFAGFDNLETAVAVIVVITWATESGTDTSVDVGIVGEQAFLRSVVKVRAVVNGRDLGGRTAKYLGLPCILELVLDSEFSKAFFRVVSYKYPNDCQSESQKQGHRHG